MDRGEKPARLRRSAATSAEPFDCNERAALTYKSGSAIKRTGFLNEIEKPDRLIPAIVRVSTDFGVPNAVRRCPRTIDAGRGDADATSTNRASSATVGLLVSPVGWILESSNILLTAERRSCCRGPCREGSVSHSVRA